MRDTKAIVVLLVDLLDASGSFLNRVRDLVGSNPVLLVGTKVGSVLSAAALHAVLLRAFLCKPAFQGRNKGLLKGFQCLPV